MTVEAAIDFLALLAYPESCSKRTRASSAMRAFCIRKQRDQEQRVPLGKLMPVQQIENQLRLLNRRLLKRLVAAHDCVKLQMGVQYEGGESLSLNDLAGDHSAYRKGYERYKSDWWIPEVMHLGLLLHGLQIGGASQKPLTAEELLLSNHWTDTAEKLAAFIALDLRAQTSPALRGFHTTTFLFP